MEAFMGLLVMLWLASIPVGILLTIVHIGKGSAARRRHDRFEKDVMRSALCGHAPHQRISYMLARNHDPELIQAFEQGQTVTTASEEPKWDNS